MRVWFGVVLGLGAGSMMAAQGISAAAVVTFTFERAGMAVPQFSLTVGEDGRGHYSATVAAQGEGAAQRVEREVVISPGRTAQIFAAARELKRFNFPCAAPMKGIASTGAKTLAYSGPDGTGKCAFDYTDSKQLTMLVSELEAVAWTMDEGRTLEFEHRFDRLGLDHEIAALADEVKEGRAMELENIAPALRSIAEDGEVIERARVKAADLLASGK